MLLKLNLMCADLRQGLTMPFFQWLCGKTVWFCSQMCKESWDFWRIFQKFAQVPDKFLLFFCHFWANVFLSCVGRGEHPGGDRHGEGLQATSWPPERERFVVACRFDVGWSVAQETTWSHACRPFPALRLLQHGHQTRAIFWHWGCHSHCVKFRCLHSDY